MESISGINVEDFAQFINQPVAIARAILVREAAEREPVHDGYDYQHQCWVGHVRP